HNTVAEPRVSIASLWRVSTPTLRNAPRAQGEKNSQYNRELLREKRHSQGDSCKKAIDPASASEAVDYDDHCTQGEPKYSEYAHYAIYLDLQSRLLWRKPFQRFANLS